MAAFASVSDFATYIQRDLTAEETATAELLLDLSSAAIRSYTGQTLSIVEDDEVTFDAPCGYRIFLPELPVIAVTSVTWDAAELTLLTDYHLYADTGTIRFAGRRWSYTPQAVVVTYDHGYATDSPQYGLAQGVCLALAKGTLTSAGVDVKSESIGNYSVTYDAAQSTLWSEESSGLRSSLDSLRLLVVA